jgi:GTPase SAR1 family protein
MPCDELAHLELLAEVDALADRLSRWAKDAPAWQPADACRALVRRLVDRAASLRVRLEAPLVVATLGGAGTGKSALINALVGAEVVRAGRTRPTTTRPTLVCHSKLTPEMLGIDRGVVELVQRDLPALDELALIDCPDPDTTEEEAPAIAPALASNLARLRTILPHCDVLLVTATQQKYRSARVADELAAAAPGAHLVFVQTHADSDDDIRDDWRHVLEAEKLSGAAGEGNGVAGATEDAGAPGQAPALTLSQRESGPVGHIFRIDSLRALAESQSGLQPRGEFAELLDLLTRRMSGAAANRIRRANFLELTAAALAACKARIDAAVPRVREVQTAIERQRALLAKQIAGEMQTELLANRRQWENRLLAQTASRWGLSPFSLVLRAYQGIGGLLTGALLYRVRTPAQMALWGALEGMRTWRKHQRTRQADRGLDQAAAGGFDPAELHKAAIIVDGYVGEAGLDRGATQWPTVAAEAETAAGGFVARVSAELESLVARLAARHAGWFTRSCYELLLTAMLGMLLYRLGKNFFYDSWLAVHPTPVYGLEFYVSAGFWLGLWCLLLLWAFCRRLKRGLRGEIDRLAVGWQDASAAAGIFASVEGACRRVEHFRRDLDTICQDVDGVRQVTASG